VGSPSSGLFADIFLDTLESQILNLPSSKSNISFWYRYVISLWTARVHFCTPENALLVWNILSFKYKILSQFVKPPSDTLASWLLQHVSPGAITIISTNYPSVPPTFLVSTWCLFYWGLIIFLESNVCDSETTRDGK
jgi:hypothetical protein